MDSKKHIGTRNNSALLSHIIDYLRNETDTHDHKNKKKLNTKFLGHLNLAIKNSLRPYSSTSSASNGTNSATNSLKYDTTSNTLDDYAVVININNQSYQDVTRIASINNCNCDRYCDLLSNVNGNLWKSTFMIMAFLILFISIMLIFLLAAKSVLSRLKNRQENLARSKANISSKHHVWDKNESRRQSMNSKSSVKQPFFESFKLMFMKSPNKKQCEIGYKVEPIFDFIHNKIDQNSGTSYSCEYPRKIETIPNNQFYTINSTNSFKPNASSLLKRDDTGEKRLSSSDISDIDFTSGLSYAKQKYQKWPEKKLASEILSNTEVDSICSCPCHKQSDDYSRHLCNRRSMKNKTINLPIRRESIKELLRTKIVSDNKQKQQIENHICKMLNSGRILANQK